MKPLRSIGIDLQGGKGNASNFPDAAPTCCAISHGTPNAVMLFSHRGVPPFPRRDRFVAPPITESPDVIK